MPLIFEKSPFVTCFCYFIFCNTISKCLSILVQLTLILAIMTIYWDSCWTYKYKRVKAMNSYLILICLYLSIVLFEAEATHAHKMRISRDYYLKLCNFTYTFLFHYANPSSPLQKYINLGTADSKIGSFPWPSAYNLAHLWRLEYLCFGIRWFSWSRDLFEAIQREKLSKGFSRAILSHVQENL